MNEVELGFPLPPGMNAVCQFEYNNKNLTIFYYSDTS